MLNGSLIELIKYGWIVFWLTLLRVLPFPGRTGLLKIGNPGRDAPVLLTGNFRLTVARVKRAFNGVDAYLLIANSRGVNVWCAATGGHMTNHDVVSVLKTSGIEPLVDHRQLILPQLVATGIEARVVRKKTGWNPVWGPIEAIDIPAFLQGGLVKTPPMRRVNFPWKRRLEVAVAWAFPISLLALPLWPWWGLHTLVLIALVWLFSLVLFLGLPLYQRWLIPAPRSVGFIFFNFGQYGILLTIWALWLIALFGFGELFDVLSWGFMLRWGSASLVILLVFGIDLTGSTPNYKSGLHPDRFLRVVLDNNLCRGAGACEQVCPLGVFQVDRIHKRAELLGIAHCVQCGACIVQCPFDALSFVGPGGKYVTPETVRQFKLNLLGKRWVDVGKQRPPK